MFETCVRLDIKTFASMFQCSKNFIFTFECYVTINEAGFLLGKNGKKMFCTRNTDFAHRCFLPINVSSRKSLFSKQIFDSKWISKQYFCSFALWVLHFCVNFEIVAIFFFSTLCQVLLLQDVVAPVCSFRSKKSGKQR